MTEVCEETLLQLLESGADGSSSTTFVSAGQPMLTLTASESWDRAALAATGLQSRCSDSGAIAAVLTNSPKAVAVAVGALRAGLQLVSLPLPARGHAPSQYLEQIRRLADAGGAERIWMDDHLVALASSYGATKVRPFGELFDHGSSFSSGRGARLVQFSSGTTGDPNGVVMTMERLGRNVRAIIEALSPEADDVLCSWLPLSHDMGLVGTLFTAAAAGASQYAHSGRLVLMRPEDFVRSPGSWLSLCAEAGATITAAPSFAYEKAAQARACRLGRMRACMVGGDLIDPDHLLTFATATGVHQGSICPAWGFAEIALAATMSRPGEPLRSVPIPESSLGTMLEEERAVSCGRPLSGVRVEVVPGNLGSLRVQSASMGDRLNGETWADEDGWYSPGDEGFVEDGEVFVLGRHDDVVIIGGANFHVAALERQLVSVLRRHHATVSQWTVAAFQDHATFSVAVEGGDSFDDAAVEDELASVCRELWGRVPRTMWSAPLGAFPRTPSGKLRRGALAATARRSSAEWRRMRVPSKRPRSDPPRRHARRTL